MHLSSDKLAQFYDNCIGPDFFDSKYGIKFVREFGSKLKAHSFMLYPVPEVKSRNWLIIFFMLRGNMISTVYLLFLARCRALGGSFAKNINL